MPDTQLDRAHFAITDSAGTAPFAPGDLVIYRDDPARDSVMTVTGCEWRCGYWLVRWRQPCPLGTRGCTGSAPADHLRSTP